MMGFLTEYNDSWHISINSLMKISHNEVWDQIKTELSEFLWLVKAHPLAQTQVVCSDSRQACHLVLPLPSH